MRQRGGGTQNGAAAPANECAASARLARLMRLIADNPRLESNSMGSLSDGSSALSPQWFWKCKSPFLPV